MDLIEILENLAQKADDTWRYLSPLSGFPFGGIILTGSVIGAYFLDNRSMGGKDTTNALWKQYDSIDEARLAAESMVVAAAQLGTVINGRAIEATEAHRDYLMAQLS